MFAEQDKVVTRVIARGTHLGPLPHIAPSARRTAMMGHEIWRVANGQILEHWGRFEDLDCSSSRASSPHSRFLPSPDVDGDRGQVLRSNQDAVAATGYRFQFRARAHPWDMTARVGEGGNTVSGWVATCTLTSASRLSLIIGPFRAARPGP